MKLLIYSDLHREFSHFVPAPEAVDQADVVILAGDIDVGQRGIAWAAIAFPGKRVLYVPGNHEFYGCRGIQLDRKAWLDELRVEGEDLGIHVLDRDEIDIEGVRFLGTTLWTDFALHAEYSYDIASIDKAMADAASGLYDFRAITEDGHAFMPRDAAREHALSRTWLLERMKVRTRKTVVITHHAPSPRSAAPRWKGHPLSPAFSSNLPPEFFETVDLWIHGHMHEACDYEHHGCRVISNPKGLPFEHVHSGPSRVNFAPPEGGQGFRPGLIAEI